MNKTEEKQFNELQEQLKAANEKIATLSDGNALQQKLEAAEAAKATLQTKLEAAEAENNALTNLNESQANKLEEIQEQLANKAVETSVPGIGVTHEGKGYTFRKNQFRIAGDPTLHKSEEAATKQDLIASILKMEGQTILIPDAE